MQKKLKRDQAKQGEDQEGDVTKQTLFKTKQVREPAGQEAPLVDDQSDKSMTDESKQVS